MKYIVTKRREVIIFQDSREHKEIADKFNGAISAGFVKVIGDQILISKQQSVSLGIGPNIKRDTELIRKQLTFN